MCSGSSGTEELCCAGIGTWAYQACTWCIITLRYLSSGMLTELCELNCRGWACNWSCALYSCWYQLVLCCIQLVTVQCVVLSVVRAAVVELINTQQHTLRVHQVFNSSLIIISCLFRDWICELWWLYRIMVIACWCWSLFYKNEVICRHSDTDTVMTGRSAFYRQQVHLLSSRPTVSACQLVCLCLVGDSHSCGSLVVCCDFSFCFHSGESVSQQSVLLAASTHSPLSFHL